MYVTAEKTKIMKNKANGPQRGIVTIHHDQSITSQSLSVIKTKKRTLKNPRLAPPLFDALLLISNS